MTGIRDMAEHSIEFVRRCGLRLVECGPGYAECVMPLVGNENHLGAMYAGAQFTLADITGGALLLASFDPEHFFPILKDLQLEFLMPATTDLRLRYALADGALPDLLADAQAGGKARLVLAGELRDGKGAVVTRCRGEFQARAR